MLNGKSRVTAGVLAILLGGLGVHKFYMGKIVIGIIYLLFCWTGIPSIIGLIEGILYLVKSDDEFQQKYFGAKA
jgi:TM2 domain-containing membrane protein YozV